MFGDTVYKLFIMEKFVKTVAPGGIVAETSNLLFVTNTRRPELWILQGSSRLLSRLYKTLSLPSSLFSFYGRLPAVSTMELSILLTLLVMTTAFGQDIFGRTFYPVILIPGLEGSRLESRRTLANDHCSFLNNNPSLLWLDPVKILGSLECFLDTFSLHYDKETHTTHNSPGVEISVPYFGETLGVETLNDVAILPDLIQAQPLVTYFVGAGKYLRGVNIRSAPYDFRKAPNELEDYFEHLRDLIEDTYNKQNMRVVIVTHSMGGLQGLYFLQRQSQEWKNQFIHRFIPVSAPYGGSMDAISAYLTGLDTVGVIPFNLMKGIKHTLTTLPALAALLPNTFGWDADHRLVDGASLNVSISTMDKLFDLLNLPDVRSMYNDTRNLLGQLDHPGVNVTCVFSAGLNTKERAHFDEATDFPDNPHWQFGDGDNVVGVKSLETCLRWSNNPSFRFSSKVFERIIHGNMVKDLRVITFLYDLIVQDKF